MYDFDVECEACGGLHSIDVESERDEGVIACDCGAKIKWTYKVEVEFWNEGKTCESSD